jgi:UDP-N-acetylglucosamine 2-epimerase (non-hydrolysing)
MKALLVAGARPNFMKIAPLFRETIRYNDVSCKIVHTGQHYDHKMSQTFFDDLEIPAPDHFLDAGSGSHASQTARIMVTFETVCEVERPDLVIVVGDVNSTLACSIVAKKMGISVAHVEAGLRSFDLTMPEEINRMVTDTLSDYFFVTEESGAHNLLREGKSPHRIHLVGNVMVDNLFHQAAMLARRDGKLLQTDTLKAGLNGYAFLTLHRPSNVDDRPKLEEIVSALNTIAQDCTIVFPMHPRTRKMVDRFDIRFSGDIKILPPLGFQDALNLWKDARVVLTDSGGLQEETTAMGVPCVTIRDNTERPVTIEMGTNLLAGTTREGILAAYTKALDNGLHIKKRPPMWDGRAAERIWGILLKDRASKCPSGDMLQLFNSIE